MAFIGQERLGRAASGAGAYLRRLAKSGGRRGQMAAAPKIVEIVLVAILGILLAILVGRLFWPLPVPVNPAPATSNVRPSFAPAAAKSPFKAAATPAVTIAPADAPEAADTTLDLMLHGTWIEEGGGSAIIRTPDGEQKAFRIGDPVCCGATLEGIYADQVTILRAGVREALRLPNKTQTSPGPTIAPPQQAVETDDGADPEIAAVLTRDSVVDLVRFQPVANPGGGLRFAVYPTTDEAAFEGLGLEAGDIVVAVNGQPAPSRLDGFPTFLANLERATSLVVEVERDGRPQTIRIDARAGQEG